MHNPVQYFTGPAHNARVTSPYGMRNDPLNPGSQRMHYGIDFGGKPRGHAWTTPYPGTVLHCRESAGRGKTVVMRIQGTNILQVTQHFDDYLCKPGDVLNSGDRLGTNGITGNVTGPHLHYELRIDNGTPLGAPVWGDPAHFTLLEVSDVKTYTVVPGDTLAKIAARFGVTVHQLRTWNNRTPDQDRSLQVGTVLFVSDPTPSGVSKSDFDKLTSRVSELERKLAEVKQIL